MGIGPSGVIRPSGLGTSLAVTSSEATVAIPTNFGGDKPKYVYLTSTASCLVLPSDDTIAVTDTTGIFTGGAFTSGFTMDVTGSSHISAKTLSGTATLYVMPLDDN